ncbi:MAG TPA: glycosyltransferase [Acidisarcina sp.]
MLTAFAHPSCKGILFRSDYALREAEEWIKRLEFDLLGSSFMAKSHVLYPAQKPCGPDIVSHKWRQDSPLRVVFCGHDYETKNGAMALRILSKVAQDLRVTCIYVGHIPRAEKGRCSDLLKNLEVFESIPRPTILKMFSEAHVLFHPSKFEGLGTVLLEAAAAAMAVVVGRGRGMSHINEVFGDDGALYVDRDFVEPEDEERAFEHGLRFVLDNRSVAREMATRNYHTAVSGRYSLDRRDKVLNNVYGEILDAPASRPLELVELPHTIPHAIKSLTSAQVREDEKVYKARLGLKQDRLLIETNR